MRHLGKYDLNTIQQAIRAFGSCLEWKRQTKLEVLESELPLISEKYRFGGTLDAMLIQSKLSLGDWKTSANIFPDFLCQLAAYGILWEENYPSMPLEGGFHLMRFSKQGDFSHHWWGELEDAKEAFLLMRRLYDLDAKLKKRV